MNNEKYWKDYTDFIREVEKLTGLSPSDLLSRYKILIEELNDSDEDYYLEWLYELSDEEWVRQKIQKVIDYKPIEGNELLINFRQQIEDLDLGIKKHIINSEQANWWNNPELKLKKS